MLSVLRLSIGAAVLGGIVAAASAVISVTSENVIPGTSSEHETIDQTNGADDALVAGRYHLRKRTGRFFNRSRRRVAGRYHLRTRSERFFDRVVG